MSSDSRLLFLEAVQGAARRGALIKITLGRPQGKDATLQNLFVRPVTLKAGPLFSFVWRYATRDVTKNYAPDEALKRIDALLGKDFLDAHLFTKHEVLQLNCGAAGGPRLHRSKAAPPGEGISPPSNTPLECRESANTHDRVKEYVIPPDAPWLKALGVTNPAGRPREGMAAKFRQIQKFAELLLRFVDEAGFSEAEPLSVCDMGCGKGYLTFAVAAILGGRARVRGIEARAELVSLCTGIASQQGFAPGLSFAQGTIAETAVDRIDALIALHACDTATDDALAKGIAAGARLLVVAPCCQKELRPQLESPSVLRGALRHGIFQERQAEFVTDALRAQLLEWAGYRTQVLEFISTEHTAKNLMIVGVRAGGRDESLAPAVRDLAAFYGIRHQALAGQLGFSLREGRT